ncbi:MAG: glycoside hydrolase family 25 protein [Lachnospiraceae bacterium]|nr:glycoside hydrolase family 25 protein [Lachnospiraceae bacterium]
MKRHYSIWISILMTALILIGCGNEEAHNQAQAVESSDQTPEIILNSGTSQEAADETLPAEDQEKEPSEYSEIPPSMSTTEEGPDSMSISSAQAGKPAEQGQVSFPEQDDSLSDNSSGMPKELDFIDAWGEWHHMIVNQNVPPCPYDWNKMSRDSRDFPLYDDENYVIHRGIDVSHHQNDIDWQKVKDQGFDFAIIRIAYRGYGNGTLNLDRMQNQNIRAAQQAGLSVGVYVFSQAITEAEALEEAELVISALKDVDLELPVVFDPELIRDDVARTDDISGNQFTRNTIAFCERVREAGFDPMVYSNLVWESEIFDMTEVSRYPIWYADCEPLPQTPYDFVFWQYDSEGKVDGVTGNVDMNIWFEKIR